MDTADPGTIGASPEVIDEVTIMLRKTGIRALQDTEQYIRKSGGKPLKRRDLTAEFAGCLSSYITTGLVSLTIERIQVSDEVRRSLKDSPTRATIVLRKVAPFRLPEYSPYVTIAVKSGAAELFRTDAAFIVQSVIGLRDTRITLQEKQIKEYKFGALNAAMSIYLKQDEVKEQLHSFTRDLTIPGMMSGVQ